MLPQALSRREGEQNLSVTWVEHFKGDWTAQVTQAIQAFRASQQSGNVGRKSVFAVAVIEKIHDLCRSRGVRVRIIHEPVDANPGHSVIRNLPNDNDDLLELLAADAFAELIRNADIP
jgi:hypothetical protein